MTTNSYENDNMRSIRLKILTLMVIATTVGACASQPKDQIMLMPAPDVFDQGDWDPFTDRNPIKDIPYGGILYATDRLPAEKKGQYYLDERGHLLRLGVARIAAGKEVMTWEEARSISLLKKRPEDYPLKVTDAREIEILKSSINAFSDRLLVGELRQRTNKQFASDINATDAPGADTGNGHAYFRKSPYTSSDILAMLMFDLTPVQRGLQQIDGRPIWTFTENYIDRLREAIATMKYKSEKEGLK
jgi:hypothetical protein